MCNYSKAVEVKIDAKTKTARIEFDDGFTGERFGWGILDLALPGRPLLVDSSAYNPRHNHWASRKEPEAIPGTLFFDSQFGGLQINLADLPDLAKVLREGWDEVRDDVGEAVTA